MKKVLGNWTEQVNVGQRCHLRSVTQKEKPFVEYTIETLSGEVIHKKSLRQMIPLKQQNLEFKPYKGLMN